MNDLLSKKLGVVAGAITSLVLLADKPNFSTISWQITVIVIVYMLIQGFLDWKKK